MANALRQSVAWVFIERGTQMLLALLVSIVLARYYGPEGFASFQAYLSLAVVWASVGYICSAEVLIPRYAHQSERYALVFEHAFLLRSVAACLAAVGYVFVITHHYGNDRWLGLPLVALVLFTEPFSAFGAYFQASGQQRVWSRIRLFWLILKVLAIVGIAVGGYPLAWVTMPYAVEALGAGLMVARRYRQRALRSPWRFNPELMRELLRHGVVMGLGLMAMVWLQKLDRLFLASREAYELLGYYAAGMQIAESWFFCAFFLVQAVGGRWVFAHAAPVQLRRVLQMTTAFAVLALAGWGLGAWLAPWVIPWIYGPEFVPTVGWLQWQLGLAVLVWCEAGLGAAMLARFATVWVAAKWMCALAAAWLMLQLGWSPWWLPSPLTIPVAGYSVAFVFSCLYVIGWWLKVSRDELKVQRPDAQEQQGDS